MFHRLVAEGAGNYGCWHAGREARDGVGYCSVTRAEIFKIGYGEAALKNVI